MANQENYSESKHKLRTLYERVKHTAEQVRNLKKINVHLKDSVSLKKIVTINVATDTLLDDDGDIIICWVAKEIYGSWDHPQVHAVRKYMIYKSPYWLFCIYYNYGKFISNFISNKPILKKILKPLFNYFARKGL